MQQEVVTKLERLKQTVHERCEALDALREKSEAGEREIAKLLSEQIDESRALKSTAEIAQINARIKILEEKLIAKIAMQPMIQSATATVNDDAVKMQRSIENKICDMDRETYLLEATFTKLEDSMTCLRERLLMAKEDNTSLSNELFIVRTTGQSDLRNSWMRSATQANLAKNKELEAKIRALTH